MSFNRERLSVSEQKRLVYPKGSANERNNLGKEGKSRGFVSGLASLLGGVVRADNQLDRPQSKSEKKRFGERPKDLTQLALKNLSGRNITVNKSDLRHLKGGVFDATRTKENYGMDSRASVFYYGAGKSHYLANGSRINPVVAPRFYGKRLFQAR